ncbi:MAG: carbonic anhydrase [Alphaproteobacteria bacterium]
MTNAFDRLLTGFKNFQATYYEGTSDLYRRLASEGQAPKVMIVGCSDSRVDPAIITHSRPGDLFIVRNVAAIVPPYEPDGNVKGTSSAIEFAVRGLEVEHIIVLGHALCGGVRALGAPEAATAKFEFVRNWVRAASSAREAVDHACSHRSPDERERLLEQATILVSMRNLMGFPWIAERVRQRKLTLHGWYFDLIVGHLFAHDMRTGKFLPIEADPEPLCRKPEACAPDCDCERRYDVTKFCSAQQE